MFEAIFGAIIEFFSYYIFGWLFGGLYKILKPVFTPVFKVILFPFGLIGASMKWIIRLGKQPFSSIMKEDHNAQFALMVLFIGLFFFLLVWGLFINL